MENKQFDMKEFDKLMTAEKEKFLATFDQPACISSMRDVTTKLSTQMTVIHSALAIAWFIRVTQAAAELKDPEAKSKHEESEHHAKVCYDFADMVMTMRLSEGRVNSVLDRVEEALKEGGK